MYANLEPIEEVLDGEVTHTFKRKSRQIILTNDSGSANLQYKLNGSEDYATLYPTESITMRVTTRDMYLKSTVAVNYRLWVYG